jgi:uncharacterized repeat protein (TIGR01451 family)
MSSSGDGSGYDRDHDCDRDHDHDYDHDDDDDCLPPVTPSSTTATLIVVTSVTNDDIGVKTASDFTDIVTGTKVLPTSTFAGSASGVSLTISSGTYSVAQAPSAGYNVTYSSGCSGTIAAGDTKTCTVSDNDKPLPAPLCSVNGLYGTYNNLPSNHPDVEGTITGVVSGTTPFQYDWYAAKYFSFATTTPVASMNQSSNFFPVNDGLSGDPFYTAIHWTGFVTFPASGTYQIALGSDDDSWAYLNGNLVGSVPGIHSFTQKNFSVTRSTAGTSTIDLYFAERHKVQSGFVFQMPGVTFSPCAPATPTSTPTSTIPSADLAIAKTADVTSTVEGGSVNYTLTVTALGPATSTGVVATDVLPLGLTFVNATASKGTYASSTGQWSIGDLSMSSTATLAVAATAKTGTASTTIVNTATVGENASTTDPNAANNTSAVSIVVVPNVCTTDCGTPTSTPTSTIPSADLFIAKTADVTSTVEGGTVNYTLMVTALGPATSTGVVATDTLPAGLAFVNATSSQGTYASSTGIWMIGNMPASSTAMLAIAVTVQAGTASTTIVNTASVGESASSTDPNPGNNNAMVSVVVTPNVCTSNCGGTATTTADLAITKTVDNANPNGGDTITYIVTVTDLGPGTSTNVTAHDLLPIGLSLNSATTSQGTYAGTGDWDIGTLNPGVAATLVISATVNGQLAGQTITNTATASELSSLPDDPANNSASVGILVQTPTPPPCTSNCGGGGGGGGGGGSSIGVGGGGSAYILTIDNGASSTATTSATLSIFATQAYTMEISNDPSFASSTWIPYATVMPWTLTPGAGTKTVYGRFRAVSGSDVGVAQDSIELLGGQVLGAGTSCGIYLNDYIRLGWNNNPSEVKKLQTFLNGNLGTNLPITGVYGQQDFNVVQQFQTKYHSQVLAPWVPLGLLNDMTPTGFVYQTTKWWINSLYCQALNLPMPSLQVYQGE